MQTTISTAKKFVKKSVRHELETGKHMPIYLHSSPGLGKSAVVKQVTNELDIGFVDVRLAQMEQSDVAGIPYVAHGDGSQAAETMKISVPEWFPSKEKIEAGEFPETGVVFFDEMSNAPIAVQHAAYRIILDREVHRDCELGDGWCIVAAGNKKEDKTGAKGVAPALANRFAMHFDIGESVEDFTLWAYENGLNEEIMGFLHFDASKLYMFDPKKNDVAFATPRSWEQVSNILEVGYSEEEIAFALGAAIGDGVASEFMSFRKYYGKLPDMQKIMNGEEKYKVDTKDNGVIFALTSSLVSNLIQNAMETDRVKNLHEVMKQLPDDFLIMLYKNVKGVFENQESKQAKEAVLNILNTTLPTFKRVSKYIRGGEIE